MFIPLIIDDAKNFTERGIANDLLATLGVTQAQLAGEAAAYQAAQHDATIASLDGTPMGNTKSRFGNPLNL